MPRLTLSVLLILAAPAVKQLPETKPAHARVSAERLARIDAVIEAALVSDDSKERIPGAVVVVGRRGSLVYRKAFGARALKPAREAMSPDSIFDLASLTKPVATATAVMLLVDDGKLALHETLAEVLPEFASRGKGAITIEQLLRHRSGLIADNPLSDYGDGAPHAWDRLANLDLVSKPGEKFTYSDVNYIILARAVERRAGQDFAEFCRARIFEPCGMADTRFGSGAAEPARFVPTEADPRDAAMLRGVVHDPRARALGGVAGHAGLFGTADDLAIYCRMLLNRGVAQSGRRVLSEAAVAAMIDAGRTPAGQRRGLGWDLDTAYSAARGDRFGPLSFGHTGFTGTSVWIDPETETFVILLASRLHPNGGGGSLNGLRRRVATLAAESIAP